MPHLRLPAFDHGVTSFLWALFFGLFIWIGGSAAGKGPRNAIAAICEDFLERRPN